MDAIRRFGRFTWQHRRRIAPAVLVVGAVVVVGQVCDAVPRETSIQYRLGPDHAEVAEISVSYVLAGEVVGGVRWRWPEGAPLAVSHDVELLPGRYEVRAEIERRGGHETITRALSVPAEGTVHIDLFDLAMARA